MLVSLLPFLLTAQARLPALHGAAQRAPAPSFAPQVLRHDDVGAETLLNLLLRNYLHYNLYDQVGGTAVADVGRQQAAPLGARRAAHGLAGPGPPWRLPFAPCSPPLVFGRLGGTRPRSANPTRRLALAG